MAMTDEQIMKSEEFKKWAEEHKEKGVATEDLFEKFKATDEYKKLAQKEEPQNPAEGKGGEEGKGEANQDPKEDQGVLELGGDGKPGNESAGLPNFWKEWAQEKNYFYEDNDAGEYDYACSVYENEGDKAAGKDPVVSVKAKGNKMFVKSDRLEVYQEIAKQAKKHNYTKINFLDTLSENQQKLLLIACFEYGLKVSGNIPEYLPLKDLDQGRSDTLAERVNTYNIRSFERKYKGKEEPITLPEGDVDLRTTAFCGAVLAGAKFPEDHQDFLPAGKTDVLKCLPEQLGLKGKLTKAIEDYNHKSAENIFNEAKTFADANKENVDAVVAKINEETNPHKKAMLWAYCKNNGIAADKLPDISNILEKTEKASRYYPEEIKKTLNEQKKNKGNDGRQGEEQHQHKEEEKHTEENNGEGRPAPQPRGKPGGHEK